MSDDNDYYFISVNVCKPHQCNILKKIATSPTSIFVYINSNACRVIGMNNVASKNEAGSELQYIRLTSDMNQHDMTMHDKKHVTQTTLRAANMPDSTFISPTAKDP